MLANKKLVVPLAVAGALLLGSLYYLSTLAREAGDFWPFVNEPGSLSAGIASLRGDVGKLQEEIKKIPAARERLEAVKVEYDLATRVLPRENSPDQLIAAIRTKAQQAGVIPTQLVPSRSRASAPRGGRNQRGGASGNFEEWTFTLRLEGTYDQIATFVNYMEEFESSSPSRTGSEKRFFQVRDIDISADQNGMGFLGNPGDDGQAAESRQRHGCSLVMQTFRYTGGN
ncbi:MAG: hypothetical protein LBU64_13285 [Planctomycetota bacterium]|jgi:hypothetical protein|nr:hypothetical protein [Planctomycetota bacterium]